MNQTPEQPARRTGRPRGFDRDAALEQALALFWTRGYEAVSMADLTAAMGIHSPSLYAAFGSKAELFAEAVRLYEERHLAMLARALDEAPTAAAGIRDMLRGSVATFTSGDQPTGCLLAVGGVNCSPENDHIADLLRARREASEALILARIERGVREGDLPESTSPAVLGAYVSTLSLGLSLQARNGATQDMLNAVVDAALSAFQQV